MVTRRDYLKEDVDAAHSVLIELAHLLGEYRDQFVVIGGWVPELLIPDSSEPHVGSLDVDIAVNHRDVPEDAYRRLEELLLSCGYERGEQPFVFYRKVGNKTVELDVLSGEYGGTGRNRRHQRFQEIRARKARGADLAIELSTPVEIVGQLPGGGRDRVAVRVASIVPFFVMKAAALDDRLKEKDAWDIDYCLRNYPGGLDAIVGAFLPQVSKGLVREAIERLGRKFETVDSVGPKFVADFDEIVDREDRELRLRDAFERMQYVLAKLRARIEELDGR